MNMTPTELLAQEFLLKARELSPDVEPIKVLKTRAYKILDSHVLVRTASLSKSNRYFFGLNYINAEEIANLDNSFIAFICGSIERTVLLPASILVQHLPFISHDRNGEYKISFDINLQLILTGRNNRFSCINFINSWPHLLERQKYTQALTTAEESLHSVIQGRLLEIGKIRGLQTFCPNKSKKFNGDQLGHIATLEKCPDLQFSDYKLLRQIDVLWFKEKGGNLIPECAFEVELSTGTWSGVGRMATLIDYANTRLYVISDETQKYYQVMRALSEHQQRYKHITPQLIGELYSSEKNLKDIRISIGL